MLNDAIDLSRPATTTPEIVKARVVTGIHVPTAGGRCAWCWDSSGVWTPHPCAVHRWADRVALDAGGEGQ